MLKIGEQQSIFFFIFANGYERYIRKYLKLSAQIRN